MRLIRLLKHDLAHEVSNWQQKNIIDEQQAEQICAEYGVDYHGRSRHTYGYYVLSGLGYLFLGLSILVVIGENWQDIPRAARMIGLIILTLLTNLAGIYRHAQGRHGEAVALLLTGSILYGASIMLIARLYHLGEHYPDGILWWATGVLPVALISRSTILMILAMILAMTWFLVEASLHYYPLLYPLFLLANIWFLIKIRHSLLLFALLVIGTGLTGTYTASWLSLLADGLYRLDLTAEGAVFIGSYVIVLHGLTKWLAAHADHTAYSDLLSLWVMRIFILLLFIMSFAGPWRELLDADWRSPIATILMLLGLCAVGIILARSDKTIFNITRVSAVGLTSVAGLIIMFGEDSHARLYQVMDNLLLVITGIWLIIRGLRLGISRYFYTGILTIMLTGLLRYIDLIGDYIGTAVLFTVFALILLTMAGYWKSRYAGRETI